jgi:signal peptidase I
MDNFYTETFPDPDPVESPERGGGFRRFLFDVLETILLAVILFLGINAISARIRVESISMQPTLYAGDFVIVNKLAYKVGAPNRGDVVVFRFPPDPEREPYIKRVIGLPGDMVNVKGGQVYINNVLIDEPYIKAAPNYEDTWTVPEGHLFVLGDNRNNSSDSHAWGYVPLENVIGKAELVYWPPSEWRVLNQETAAAAGPDVKLE